MSSGGFCGDDIAIFDVSFIFLCYFIYNTGINLCATI